jgi:tetratricopeptide (TPR) repeat protein
LQPQVFVPARDGSLQAEMLATARRHGRLAVTLPARLDALLTEVADARPVLVLQNLSLPIAPQWHYAVVIGYDLDHGEIVLHSGRTERQRLPFEVFEHTWARSGFWAMAADTPARLPRTPSAEALINAAIALERVDAHAARVAYEALTQRVPTAFLAWLGLGNTAFADADYAKAALAFEHAIQLDADSGDAWNNLANAWLALGRWQDALRAAQRAVAIGGPRTDRYRATLATIEQASR